MNAKVWPEEGAEVNFTAVCEGAELSGEPGVALGHSAVGRLAGREAPQLVGTSREARAWLQRLAETLETYRFGDETARLPLQGLSARDRSLIEQALGSGEVRMALTGAGRFAVQESVLAGVWRIDEHDSDGRLIRQWVEIGAIPEQVRNIAVLGCERELEIPDAPEGTMNVMPVLGEIRDAALHFRRSGEGHSINLSLLPMTPEDLRFLRQVLGDAGIAIESSGYSSCRIHATAWRHVWSVQYFNAMDTMILNTLEIGDVPTAARAAREDLGDSAVRLHEILQAYFEDDG